MLTEIKLPVLGEKVDTADIAQILVHEGESIHREDPLLELESEKAVIEFPSPVEGTIREIKVHTGDKIHTGEILFLVDTDESVIPGTSLPTLESGFSGELDAGNLKPELDENLITSQNLKKEKRSDSETNHQENIAKEITPKQPNHEPAPASPASRRLARELGADIHRIRGNGANGFVSKEDVIHYVKDTMSHSLSKHNGGSEDLPDLSQWGPIRIGSLSSVRRTTAELISESVRIIPQVTQYDKADITQLEKFRNQYNLKLKDNSRRITITPILIKITAIALQKFEYINASIDMKNENIIMRDYIHIGVAVDTAQGLLVPVIRNADKKGIVEIALELSELVSKARNKKLKPDEMKGATFSISNLGGFGTTYFTPLVMWPQTGILGIGRAELQPEWNGENFIPQLILPLSLSYDHRLIDGAYAAKFLRYAGESLEEPLNILL